MFKSCCLENEKKCGTAIEPQKRSADTCYSRGTLKTVLSERGHAPKFIWDDSTHMKVKHGRTLWQEAKSANPSTKKKKKKEARTANL
jgi:hypothetical protein